jgi:predicted nuclease of predicted toxin-antitoxin system
MNGLYFDEHMSRKVAAALTAQGIPTVMAVDVGMEARSDEEHLAYATEQQLIMVTFDHPFAGRTQVRSDFFGLICLPYRYQNDIGGTITLLSDLAQLFDPNRDKGVVLYPQ